MRRAGASPSVAFATYQYPGKKGKRQVRRHGDEPYWDSITEQVGVDVLGSPAHVFLLKATNSFTNGRFEFPWVLIVHQLAGDGNKEDWCPWVVCRLAREVPQDNSGNMILRDLLKENRRTTALRPLART